MENKRVIGNEPAYPVAFKALNSCGEETTQFTAPGETIRQHACLMAMQGLLSNTITTEALSDDILAIAACKIADAVLAREEATRNG